MDRARVAAGVVSLALIAATLEPLVRRPYDDGFPLSTYPMFATKRDTVQTFHYALGLTRDGKRRTLSPALIGSGEVLQALRVIERAMAGGQPGAMALCETIAKRVAGDDDFADVDTIRIVTGTHDAVRYLSNDEIGTEIERVRCEVKR
ncbi:MAG TPA: hypothetical protein VL326_04335 [Kofleriaceae bacterium]|jgi:hypothetical protein|nr:hypothetical protein [Kofleriaceae bacterium]